MISSDYTYIVVPVVAGSAIAWGIFNFIFVTRVKMSHHEQSTSSINEDQNEPLNH